jgi:D-cysteine desulfhydrase
MTATLPLFTRFPALAETLPHLSLGSMPTPVSPLAGLSRKLRRNNLFIKRDDLSGLVYGGNKVRKLEFLLADAKKQGAVRVITNGAAGSNHALATALYAQRAGLRATLVLSEQTPSPAIAGNLLADACAGAEMIYVERYNDIAAAVAEKVSQYKKTEGRAPYEIPAGGSSPLGAIGYVNAAFELWEQIDKGAIPEPGAIVVAFGTMGTAAGMLLGMKAAGLRAKLVAVRVVPAFVANGEKFTALFGTVNALLRSFDPSVPVFSPQDDDYTLCNDYYEPGYGSASKEVTDAIAALERSDGIHLDITYSGKAFAAFYALARDIAGNDVPLLFWNTKNSRELSKASALIDYHTLPAGFHKYFL